MNSIKPESQTIQPRIATIILLSIILIAAIIVLLWAAGVGVIEDIFAYLNLLQEQPPIWVEAPMTMSQFILAPTVIFFLTAITITRVSPQPRTWSRVLVISILLLLTIRYLLWRSLSTLNLSSPLNGTFSIALLVLEFLTIFSASLQLFLMLKVKNRQGEAEELAVQVINKSFNPTVDILIPTYDEPAFILKKTIIGCQAIDYEPKTIYLLDDTRREEIRQLAARLGLLIKILLRPKVLFDREPKITAIKVAQI